jgi:NAD(P)H-dependent FMN reductase
MAEKILAFAGSLRSGSFNRKLIRIAAEAARESGAIVDEIHLGDIPMPLYDADVEREHGLPANAKLFKQLLVEHRGVLIGSPEYNTGMSAVLKNAIDWASRPEPGEPSYLAFKGKVGGIMSTSPGNFGGVRSLGTLRGILSYLGMIVVPTQLAIPRANAAFDPEGNLTDESYAKTVQSIGVEVVTFLHKFG